MKKNNILFLLLINLVFYQALAAGEEPFSGVPWFMIVKQSINFVIFLFLLVFLSREFIKTFFQKRQDDFLSYKRRAQTLREKAQAKRDQAQKDLYFLEQKAKANKQQARKEAQKLKINLLAQTQADCEKIEKEAQIMVQKKYHQTIRSLCKIFFKEASDKACDTFVHLKDSDQKKIQKDFVKKLKKVSSLDV